MSRMFLSQEAAVALKILVAVVTAANRRLSAFAVRSSLGEGLKI
ncbi:MAG: hypothetical protein VB084_09020 [Syntrophomonadaceae bacterium]|nr:hypothetical protein [Syntrophomonadaceae bacterium]